MISGDPARIGFVFSCLLITYGVCSVSTVDEGFFLEGVDASRPVSEFVSGFSCMSMFSKFFGAGRVR